VKVKRRKVVVKARAAEGVTRDEGRSRLSSTMQDRLDRLSLADARRLKVKVVPEPDKGTPEEPAGLTTSEPSATGAETDDRQPVGATGGSDNPSRTGGAA
jgi:hypothetical protein